MNRRNYRHPIVTGGTRGIGHAIARALLQNGCAVLLCGTTRAGVDQAVERLCAEHGDAVQGRACDVGDSAQVRILFEDAQRQFGGRVEIRPSEPQKQ